MTKPSGFGADARLNARKDFRLVFETGRKAIGRWLILWCREGPSGAQPRLGLSVSAKVGGAVRRNRLKRLLREAFRLHRSELASGLEMVSYPRPGVPWITLREAESDLLDLLRQAGRLKA